MIDELTDRFQLVAEHHHIGRSREALGPDLRSLSVQDYIVFYRLRRNDVAILRILHGRRDLDVIFGTP